LGRINGIIGKRARKSQNFSVVMVFRRSLVRELTATAIALFVVLLGILFTNLALRLLARAAGGTIAAEGILALLGFNALFYFNILLSVALFVTAVDSFANTIRNVFLHSMDNGKDITTVARSGFLEDAANGDRFIVLKEGRRYEGQPGTAEFRSVEFERLGRRIEPSEARSLPLSLKALPTEALIASNGSVERAELFWRLSVPISAFVLLLLAIPLSYVNPRMGRSFNLISGAFMYMVYYNCLNLVQSVIAQGKLSMVGGLVLIHSIAIAAVVLMFWNRLSVTGLFQRLARA